MINRLWILPANRETFKVIEDFDRVHMTADHCLIISPEQPPDAVEADDELLRLLDAEDKQWLAEQSSDIAEAQYRQNAQKIYAGCNRILDSFAAALELKKRIGGSSG